MWCATRGRTRRARTTPTRIRHKERPIRPKAGDQRQDGTQPRCLRRGRRAQLLEIRAFLLQRRQVAVKFTENIPPQEILREDLGILDGATVQGIASGLGADDAVPGRPLGHLARAGCAPVTRRGLRGRRQRRAGGVREQRGDLVPGAHQRAFGVAPRDTLPARIRPPHRIPQRVLVHMDAI